MPPPPLADLHQQVLEARLQAEGDDEGDLRAVPQELLPEAPAPPGPRLQRGRPLALQSWVRARGRRGDGGEAKVLLPLGPSLGLLHVPELNTPLQGWLGGRGCRGGGITHPASSPWALSTQGCPAVPGRSLTDPPSVLGTPRSLGLRRPPPKQRAQQAVELPGPQTAPRPGRVGGNPARCQLPAPCARSCRC